MSGSPWRRLSEYQINQAIRSNALCLAGPSQEEREQWKAERIEQESQRLRNADSRTLKQETRDGYADRQRDAAQAEADRIIDEKRKWQTGLHKTLPREWNGERLDAETIRRASPQQIRKWRELFGSLALDLRLRGEN